MFPDFFYLIRKWYPMAYTILVIQFITQLLILLFSCKLFASILTFIITYMNSVLLFTEVLNFCILTRYTSPPVKGLFILLSTCLFIITSYFLNAYFNGCKDTLYFWKSGFLNVKVYLWLYF